MVTYYLGIWPYGGACYSFAAGFWSKWPCGYNNSRDLWLGHRLVKPIEIKGLLDPIHLTPICGSFLFLSINKESELNTKRNHIEKILKTIGNIRDWRRFASDCELYIFVLFVVPNLLFQKFSLVCFLNFVVTYFVWTNVQWWKFYIRCKQS